MPSPASSHVRLRVAGMLFVTVAINYLDRSNLSVASIGIARELQLDPVRLGLIFSAFGWTYAFFQIPGGWLVDRIGARPLYAAVCGLWSLATVAQGFAHTFLLLFGLRLLLGLFEAPAFPICNKLATSWFPENERAAAIGFYTAGQYAGLAFLTFVLARAQALYGWHCVFFITGGIGLGWAAFWYLFYRDPARHPGLSQRGARIHPRRWRLDRRRACGRTDFFDQRLRPADRPHEAQAVGNLPRPVRAQRRSLVLHHLVPHLPRHLSAL